MKDVTKYGVSYSIILYGLLHFITYFYPNPFLQDLLALSGLGLFIFALLFRGFNQLKMPLSLLVIGLIILMTSDTDFLAALRNGLLQMRNMIGLLIMIPLISWVLKEEPFMEAIVAYGNRLLNTSRKFYFGMISFVQIIAYFLLFGAIQMVYHFVDDILKDKKGEAWENFKATALLRGFALSVMWVVSIPSFIYVVEVMDASLYLSILQGAGISVIGIVIALVFSYFEEKKYGVDLTAGVRSEFAEVLEMNRHPARSKCDFIEFCVLFLTLFGTIFIVQGFVDIELLVLIPLIVLVWMVLYYFYKKRLPRLLKYSVDHAQGGITKGVYQLTMMLGAGVMIFALNEVGFAPVVMAGIYQVQELFPFFNILYFLPFIIIILGFFGLGPLTVMALVGGVLGGLDLPYPPEIIVLAVTLGSAISILLSPLILPVITLSNANRLSVFKNGIGFNWLYALVLYIVAQIYIQLVVW